MLEVIDRNATAAEFTEDQAREDLKQRDGARPSIRALATAWHWNKSRTERFLSRLDVETAGEIGETTGDDVSQQAPTRDELRNLFTNGLAEFDQKIGARGDAALIEAAVEHTAARIEAEQTRQTYSGQDFEWGKDDSVLIPEQQAVAAYFNNAGDLVIRQQKAWNEEEDAVIIINAKNSDAFLEKLCDVMGIPSSGRL